MLAYVMREQDVATIKDCDKSNRILDRRVLEIMDLKERNKNLNQKDKIIEVLKEISQTILANLTTPMILMMSLTRTTLTQKKFSTDFLMTMILVTVAVAAILQSAIRKNLSLKQINLQTASMESYTILEKQYARNLC